MRSAERVNTVAERLGCKPAAGCAGVGPGPAGRDRAHCGRVQAASPARRVGALSIQLDADTRAYLEEPYRPKPVSGHT